LNPSILVIEDNEANRYLAEFILRKNGFEVSGAQSGQEGIDIAAKQPFDLVLLDIQMPMMDGYEVLRELRRLSAFKETPILALTALAMSGDREKALAAGFDGYLEKPIDVPTLVAEVKRHLLVRSRNAEESASSSSA
jgi:two-component system cell cycle response regulator DivK